MTPANQLHTKRQITTVGVWRFSRVRAFIRARDHDPSTGEHRLEVDVLHVLRDAVKRRATRAPDIDGDRKYGLPTCRS